MKIILEKIINNFAVQFNKSFKNNINQFDNFKIIDIVTIFNNNYQEFIKEYQKLPKLDLSDYIKFYFYSSSETNDLLILDLYGIKEKIYNENNWISLELTRNREKYKAYLSNGLYSANDKYHEKININPKIIKNYIELISKYNKLINNYSFFKEYYMCNGYTFLHIKLDDNILNNLETFKFCFGNETLNINITFKLENNLSIIDYDVKIEGINEIPKCKKKEIITYLLNNLYVSNNNLSSLYKNDDDFDLIDKNKVFKKQIIK